MEKQHKLKQLFSDDEWKYFLRLGNAMSTAEEKSVFFDTIKAKKLANKNYSVFDDFPKADSMQICRSIIKALEAANAKKVELDKVWTPKRAKSREMLSRLFGELILQGFHDPKEEKAG